MSFLGGLLGAATGFVKKIFTGGGTQQEQPKQNTQAGGQNPKPQPEQQVKPIQPYQYRSDTIAAANFLEKNKTEVEAVYKAEREAQIKKQQEEEAARIEEQKKKYMEQKSEFRMPGVNKFFADFGQWYREVDKGIEVKVADFFGDDKRKRELEKEIADRKKEHDDYWNKEISNDAGTTFENWAGRKMDHIGNTIATVGIGVKNAFSGQSTTEATKRHSAISKAIEEKWNQKDTEEAEAKMVRLDRNNAIQDEYIEKYKDLFDQKTPRNIDAAQMIVQEEIRKEQEYQDLLEKIKIEHDYTGKREHFEARHAKIKEKRLHYVKNYIAPLVFEGYGIDEAVDILTERDPEYKAFREETDHFETDHDWAMANQSGGKLLETLFDEDKNIGNKAFEGLYHTLNIIGSGFSFWGNFAADRLTYAAGDGKGFDNLSRLSIYNKDSLAIGRTWQDAKNILGGITTEILPELAGIAAGTKGASAISSATTAKIGAGINALGQRSNTIASIIDKTNKITHAMQSSRAGSTLIRFGDEMLTDTLLYDPLINGALGIQYSEEQFKSDLGTNLMFNPLIAMFSRGGNGLKDSLHKFNMNKVLTPEGNLKLTEHEIDLINKGETDVAEVSVLNRMNTETQFAYNGNKSIHPKFQKEIDTKTFKADSPVGKASSEMKQNIANLMERVSKGEHSAKDTNKIFTASNHNLYRNGYLDYDELKRVDEQIQQAMNVTDKLSEELTSTLGSSAKYRFQQAKLQEGIRSGAIDIEKALTKQAEKYPEKAETVELFRSIFNINPNPAIKFTGAKSSPNLMRNKLNDLIKDIFVEEVIKPRKYQPYQRITPRHVVTADGQIKNVDTGLYEDVDQVIRSLGTRSENFFSRTLDKGLHPTEKIANPVLRDWFQNRMDPNVKRGNLSKFLKHKDPNRIPADQVEDVLASLIDRIEENIISKGKEVTTDAVRRHDVFKAFKKDANGQYTININHLDKKKVLREIQEKFRMNDSGQSLFDYIKNIKQHDRIIGSIKEDGLAKTIVKETEKHPNFVKRAWKGFHKVMTRKTTKSIYSVPAPSSKTMNMIISQFKKLYPSIQVEYGKLPEGAKGATSFRDGKIIIDLEKASTTTPLHEYSHVWVKTARQQNLPEYNYLQEYIVKSDYYDMVKEKYAGIYKSEDDFIDEAIVHAIEDAGKRFYSSYDRKYFIRSVKDFFTKMLEFFSSFFTPKEQREIDSIIKQISNDITQDILGKGDTINRGLKMQELDILDFSPDDVERTAYFIQQVATKISEDETFLKFMKAAEGDYSKEQVVFHMIDAIVNGKDFKNESMNQLADTLFEHYNVLLKYIDGDLITQNFVNTNMNTVLPINTYYSLIANYTDMLTKNLNNQDLSELKINENTFKTLFEEIKNKGVHVKDIEQFMKPNHETELADIAHAHTVAMIRALASSVGVKRFFIKGSLGKTTGIDKLLKEIDTIKSMPLTQHEKHEELIKLSTRTAETIFGELFEGLSKKGTSFIEDTVFKYTTDENGIQTSNFNEIFALLQAIRTPRFVTFEGSTQSYLHTVDSASVVQFAYPKEIITDYYAPKGDSVKTSKKKGNRTVLVDKETSHSGRYVNRKLTTTAEDVLSLPKPGGNTYIIVSESIIPKAGYKFSAPKEGRNKFITIDEFLSNEEAYTNPNNVFLFSAKDFNENAIQRKYADAMKLIRDSKHSSAGKAPQMQFADINVYKNDDEYIVDHQTTVNFLKDMKERGFDIQAEAFSDKKVIQFYDYDNRSVMSETDKDSIFANAITDALSKKEQSKTTQLKAEQIRKRNSQVKKTLTKLGIDQSDDIQASMGDMLATLNGISADTALLSRAVLSAVKNKKDLSKIAQFDKLLIGKSLFYWYAQALKYDPEIAAKSPLNLNQNLLKTLVEKETTELSQKELDEIWTLEEDNKFLMKYLNADQETRKSLEESVTELIGTTNNEHLEDQIIGAINTNNKAIEQIKEASRKKTLPDLEDFDEDIAPITAESLNEFIEKLIDSGADSEVIMHKLIGIIKADPNNMKNIILESDAFEFLPKMDHFIANNMIATIAKEVDIDTSKLEEYLERIVSNNTAINISKNKNNVTVRRFIIELKKLGIINNYPTSVILKSLSETTKDNISQIALSYIHKDIIASYSSEQIDDFITSTITQLSRQFGGTDNMNNAGFKVIDASLTSGEINNANVIDDAASSKPSIEDPNDQTEGVFEDQGVDGMLDISPEQVLKIKEVLEKTVIENQKTAVRSLSPSTYNFDSLPPSKEWDKENPLNLLWKTADARTDYTFKGDYTPKNEEQTKKYLEERTTRKNALEKEGTGTDLDFIAQELERKILAVSDTKNFSQKAAMIDYNNLETIETMEFKDSTIMDIYFEQKGISMLVDGKKYDGYQSILPRMLDKYLESLSSKDPLNILTLQGPNGFQKNYTINNIQESPIFKYFTQSLEERINKIEKQIKDFKDNPLPEVKPENVNIDNIKSSLTAILEKSHKEAIIAQNKKLEETLEKLSQSKKFSHKEYMLALSEITDILKKNGAFNYRMRQIRNLSERALDSSLASAKRLVTGDKDKYVSSPDQIVNIISGAAKGSDTIWAKIGQKYGITTKNFTAKEMPKLTKEQEYEYRDFLRNAYESYGRSMPTDDYVLNLQKRNLLIADYSNQIIAIDTIIQPGYAGTEMGISSKVQINGGAKTAIDRAKYKEKPIFIFNQSDKSGTEIGWYYYDYRKQDYIKMDKAPVLKSHPGLIGTRTPTPEAESEMAKVFESSFQKDGKDHMPTEYTSPNAQALANLMKGEGSTMEEILDFLYSANAKSKTDTVSGEYYDTLTRLEDKKTLRMNFDDPDKALQDSVSEIKKLNLGKYTEDYFINRLQSAEGDKYLLSQEIASINAMLDPENAFITNFTNLNLPNIPKDPKALVILIHPKENMSKEMMEALKFQTEKFTAQGKPVKIIKDVEATSTKLSSIKRVMDMRDYVQKTDDNNFLTFVPRKFIEENKFYESQKTNIKIASRMRKIRNEIISGYLKQSNLDKVSDYVNKYIDPFQGTYNILAEGAGVHTAYMESVTRFLKEEGLLKEDENAYDFYKPEDIIERNSMAKVNSEATEEELYQAKNINDSHYAEAAAGNIDLSDLDEKSFVFSKGYGEDVKYFHYDEFGNKIDITASIVNDGDSSIVKREVIKQNENGEFEKTGEYIRSKNNDYGETTYILEDHKGFQEVKAEFDKLYSDKQVKRDSDQFIHAAYNYADTYIKLTGGMKRIEHSINPKEIQILNLHKRYGEIIKYDENIQAISHNLQNILQEHLPKRELLPNAPYTVYGTQEAMRTTKYLKDLSNTMNKIQNIQKGISGTENTLRALKKKNLEGKNDSLINAYENTLKSKYQRLENARNSLVKIEENYSPKQVQESVTDNPIANPSISPFQVKDLSSKKSITESRVNLELDPSIDERIIAYKEALEEYQKKRAKAKRELKSGIYFRDIMRKPKKEKIKTPKTQEETIEYIEKRFCLL